MTYKFDEKGIENAILAILTIITIGAIYSVFIFDTWIIYIIALIASAFIVPGVYIVKIKPGSKNYQLLTIQ